MKNPLVPKTKEQRSPESVDWLAKKRAQKEEKGDQRTSPINWKRKLKNSPGRISVKYEHIMKESEALERKAKQMEQKSRLVD